MNTLHIYNSEKDMEVSGEGYLYNLNSGQLKLKNYICINDPKLLNEKALEERTSYLNFIYTINDHFLSKNLIYEKQISLYFFSDVSNKRTELFDTYLVILHLMVIYHKLKNKNINKVVFIGCEKRFTEAFISKFDIKNIEYRNLKSSKKNHLVLKQIKFFFFLLY